jgi:hypothetical protein
MADIDNKPTDEAQPESGGGLSATAIAMIAAAVLIGIIVLVVVVALLLAQGDVDRIAPIIQIFRDVFIIFLALQGVMIILALTVLIAQLARLINLLQNEVKPILQNTQDTVKTASGTVRFVSQNLTGPIVKIGGFMAGVSVLMREVGGLRRALRTEPNGAATQEDDKTAAAKETKTGEEREEKKD